MSKIKILDTNKGLYNAAKAMFDTVLELQSDADRQVRSMRDVEAKIAAIEKTRQTQEEQRRKEEEEQRKAAEQQAAASAAEENVVEELKLPPKPAPLHVKSVAAAPTKPAEPATGQHGEPAEKKAAPEEVKPAVETSAGPKTADEQPRASEAVSARETGDSEAALTEAPAPETQSLPARKPAAQKTAAAKPAASKPRGTQSGSSEERRQAAVSRQQTAGPAGSTSRQGDHSRKKRDEAPDRGKKKKPVIKERVFANVDEFPKGSRRRPNKKPQKRVPVEPIRIDRAVITEETVSVKLLSEKIGKPVSEILRKLLLLGLMSNINSQIDFDTAQLVSSEFGVELEQKVEKTAEEILVEEKEDTEEQLRKRPPVVTIMGHVDHGKTSLLDRIRVSHVTDTEAGGITQHIGAYQVELNNEKITFIDTPGHEAFTAMRARGAQVTDIAVIVVAADDGIMPQTIEAINHAKSADVPIVVAVNKIDRENANPQKIMQELTEYDLLPEEWGGDTVVVPVSAKTGEGIDKLLEMILLVADMQELRANPDRLAKGTIVEAQLDKGRGPVATVLVQNGTLKIGDTIIAGVAYGRVRAMVDDRGKNVKAATPSQPVEVIGFSEVPVAGDLLHAAEGGLSKKVAEERRAHQKAEKLKKVSQVSLDDLFSQIAEGQIKDLNIVIKADVQGSVEAVRQSLEKLSNPEVRVKAIHTGVGAITETDVLLATAANAIIVGFNVRPDAMAATAAEREQVDIRLYRVIYKAIEDIEDAMKGMLEPEYEEAVTGHAEVRQTFKVSSIGTIAGCYVQDGVIRRNSQIRLLRDNVVIHEGALSSLRRFKDDVKEVAAGYECGMSIENYNDIKVGDVVECFEMREIER